MTTTNTESIPQNDTTAPAYERVPQELYLLPDGRPLTFFHLRDAFDDRVKAGWYDPPKGENISPGATAGVMRFLIDHTWYGADKCPPDGLYMVRLDCIGIGAIAAYTRYCPATVKKALAWLADNTRDIRLWTRHLGEGEGSQKNFIEIMVAHIMEGYTGSDNSNTGYQGLVPGSPPASH